MAYEYGETEFGFNWGYIEVQRMTRQTGMRLKEYGIKIINRKTGKSIEVFATDGGFSKEKSP